MTDRPDHLVLAIENLSRLSEALQPWIDTPQPGAAVLPERTLHVSAIWGAMEKAR